MTIDSKLDELKRRFDDDGYVVVRGLLSDEELSELRTASERAVTRARKGEWPYRRTVGSQFPPYNPDSPDSWGIQHAMHPNLGEPAFSKWYTSEKVRKMACALMECDEDQLQMELFNILINPLEHDFALRWHRDDVRENATPEEELEALRKWHYGVQWNTALYEDSCLYVVPGTHKTARTDTQRALSLTSEAPKNPMDMPGCLQVVLQPGDTVFYNNNILHCATYDSSRKRATLHPCMGNTAGGPLRARNILQHGLNWMKDEQFRQSLGKENEPAQRMLDRLLELQSKHENGEIKYSLNN